MFGLFKSSLPITEEQRLWIDESFTRLADLLGHDRMLDATVMLPTQEHFPDLYDGTERSLHLMFARVAEHMRVNPTQVNLQLFTDTNNLSRDILPLSFGQSSGAGGVYFHSPGAKIQIAVNESKLQDPLALVATLAHELGHVILLRPGLVDRESADMEPLNDLLTVYLGMGVFNANAAFQFRQYTDNEKQGWSVQRLGYLPETMFGYALARFALERGEVKPVWATYLSTNVGAYLKQSAAWLKANKATS